MVIDVVLVVAVQGSREIAGLPRSGRNCDRAKRPWGEGKFLAQYSKVTNWTNMFFDQVES